MDNTLNLSSPSFQRNNTERVIFAVMDTDRKTGLENNKKTLQNEIPSSKGFSDDSEFTIRSVSLLPEMNLPPDIFDDLENKKESNSDSGIDRDGANGSGRGIFNHVDKPTSDSPRVPVPGNHDNQLLPSVNRPSTSTREAATQSTPLRPYEKEIGSHSTSSNHQQPYANALPADMKMNMIPSRSGYREESPLPPNRSSHAPLPPSHYTSTPPRQRQNHIDQSSFRTPSRAPVSILQSTIDKSKFVYSRLPHTLPYYLVNRARSDDNVERGGTRRGSREVRVERPSAYWRERLERRFLFSVLNSPTSPI